MRVVIYARYSSDHQRAASIDDQFKVCRERAKREGWEVVGTYKDAGLSGASMVLRPGIQALLQNAQAGGFDLVVAEALDRISRDQADVATLFKHLKFAGVPITTLAEGEISELHVGLKGTMNALFLKDLAAKTHRGMSGRVEAGKSGGGLCYGYKAVKHFDARGEPLGATGRSCPHRPRSSAASFGCLPPASPALHREHAQQRGQPRPRREALGRHYYPRPCEAWHGDRQQRALYRPAGLEPAALPQGSVNRQASLAAQSGDGVDREGRSRAAHRRRCTLAGGPRPPGRDRRDLRQRHGRRPTASSAEPPQRAEAAESLLSGLVTCGCCAGPYALRGADRFACSNHVGKATCDNSRTIRRVEPEARVLAGLKDRMMAPEIVEEAMRAYAEETNRSTGSGALMPMHGRLSLVRSNGRSPSSSRPSRTACTTPR